MAYTRPGTLPRWTFLNDGSGTLNDVTNVTSGKKNVETPDPAKLSLGFDLAEFPPRQDFNWLQRWNALWLAWLDQREQAITADIAGIPASLAYLERRNGLRAITGMSVVSSGSTISANMGAVLPTNINNRFEFLTLGEPQAGRWAWNKIITGIGYVPGQDGNPIPSSMPAPSDGDLLNIFFVKFRVGGVTYYDVAVDNDYTGSHFLTSAEMGNIYETVRIGSIKINSWAAKSLYTIRFRHGASVYQDPIELTVTDADFTGPTPYAAFVSIAKYCPMNCLEPNLAAPIVSVGAPSVDAVWGSVGFNGALVDASDLYNAKIFNIGRHDTTSAFGAVKISEPVTGGSLYFVLNDAPTMTIKVLIHGWRENSFAR